jgi:hypothetical protein
VPLLAGGPVPLPAGGPVPLPPRRRRCEEVSVNCSPSGDQASSACPCYPPTITPMLFAVISLPSPAPRPLQRGSLRVDVTECERSRAFGHPLGRHLSGHNLAEKAVGHRRNLNVRPYPRYCLRSVAPATPAPHALSRRRRSRPGDLHLSVCPAYGPGQPQVANSPGVGSECRELGFAANAAPGQENLWLRVNLTRCLRVQCT